MPFALPPDLTDHADGQSIDVARGPTDRQNHDNNRQPVGRLLSEKTILTAPNILRPLAGQTIGAYKWLWLSECTTFDERRRTTNPALNLS